MSEGVVCYYGDFFSEKIFKMPIKDALDKYLNVFAIGMAAAGVAGFLVVKLVLSGHGVEVERVFPAPGGGEAMVTLKSVPTEADKHLWNYRLAVTQEGDSVGADVADGPYPTPTKGEADVYFMELGSDRAMIAAAFYSDLTVDEEASDSGAKDVVIKRTDGITTFFLLEGGKLTSLGRFEYPRYQLKKTGDYDEIRIKSIVATAGAGSATLVMVELTSFEHQGVSDEEAMGVERKLRFRLEGGRLVEETE